MSSLTTHPAFDARRPWERRASSLNDIRAVLPLEASDACRAVWTAMHRADAVPAALRALQALPEAMQAHINSMSQAIGR